MVRDVTTYILIIHQKNNIQKICIGPSDVLAVKFTVFLLPVAVK